MNNIQGWMGEPELEWLFEMAKGMRSIIEIGSWKGRSTLALLSGCPGPVYAVDHFKGDSDSFIQQGMVKREDVYETFMKNVGHFPNLRVLRMNSSDAARGFSPMVDMVFIDGEHSYDSVKADLEAWLPKAKKLICGHDWEPASMYEGLRQAVHEKLGEVKSFKSIWFKELNGSNS